MPFLTIALLTTDVFSILWHNIREFPGLGVEVHKEVPPMTQLSPGRKRIASHRMFCSLCFIARSYKATGPDFQLSLLTRIQLWDWSRGTINCQTESRLWLQNREKEKVCVKKLPGWMWDDWSSQRHNVSEAQEGVGERQGSEFIFNCWRFFFFFTPRTEKRWGRAWKKGLSGRNSICFCLCLILFLFLFLGWKNLKHTS